MTAPSRYEQNADAVDHLVLECGAFGYSKAQISACLGISRETFTHWIKTYPRFADVYARAETLAQAWWEGRAMDGTANSKIGQTVWQKSMAARYPVDYADRQEIGEIGDAGRASKIEWEVVSPKKQQDANTTKD